MIRALAHCPFASSCGKSFWMMEFQGIKFEGILLKASFALET
jgi:hypothetical protein